MKKVIFFLIIISLLILEGCRSNPVPVLPPEVYTYNPRGTGSQISIDFTRGKSFNHPLMVFWIEDENGNFIQTLYVSESIGKGVFQHGDAAGGKWMPGELRRPAALPVWSHKRAIKASDGLYIPDKANPVPDAYTGPTPGGNFILNAALDNNSLKKFTLWFEINQTWDWNEYWTNNKYPDDEEYKTSCQPALVYKVEIDTESSQKEYELKVVGHGHHSGKNGDIFPDLSTITTALDIVGSIKVGIN